MAVTEEIKIPKWLIDIPNIRSIDLVRKFQIICPHCGSKNNRTILSKNFACHFTKCHKMINRSVLRQLLRNEVLKEAGLPVEEIQEKKLDLRSYDKNPTLEPPHVEIIEDDDRSPEEIEGEEIQNEGEVDNENQFGIEIDDEIGNEIDKEGDKMTEVTKETDKPEEKPEEKPKSKTGSKITPEYQSEVGAGTVFGDPDQRKKDQLAAAGTKIISGTIKSGEPPKAKLSEKTSDVKDVVADIAEIAEMTGVSSLLQKIGKFFDKKIELLDISEGEDLDDEEEDEDEELPPAPLT